MSTVDSITCSCKLSLLGRTEIMRIPPSLYHRHLRDITALTLRYILDPTRSILARVPRHRFVSYTETASHTDQSGLQDFSVGHMETSTQVIALLIFVKAFAVSTQERQANPLTLPPLLFLISPPGALHRRNLLREIWEYSRDISPNQCTYECHSTTRRRREIDCLRKYTRSTRISCTHCKCDLHFGHVKKKKRLNKIATTRIIFALRSASCLRQST